MEFASAAFSAGGSACRIHEVNVRATVRSGCWRRTEVRRLCLGILQQGAIATQVVRDERLFSNCSLAFEAARVSRS